MSTSKLCSCKYIIGWWCYFVSKMHTMLMFDLDSTSLYVVLMHTLCTMSLSMLFCFIPCWCFTWIQPVGKLCSCIPCVLWVLECSFGFKNTHHVAGFTWIQPVWECRLCSCRYVCICTDLQFNTISCGCQIVFKQDVSFGCCSSCLSFK